jgi:glycerate 2-kinase
VHIVKNQGEITVLTPEKASAVALFNAAVDAVAGYNATYRAVLAFEDFKPDQIIAVGKAASGMCAGALAALTTPCNALLVTKYDHTDKAMQEAEQVSVIEAAHPVPDHNSLRAGKAMLATVQALPKDSRLLLLVSGGASALSEALPEDVSLEQWQQLTNTMLAAGFNIGQINTRRKETSLIKDGKLLEHFQGLEVRVLAISDVEGDSISVIGSGTGDTKRCHAKSRIDLIGTNEVARLAAEQHATSLGLSVKANQEIMYQDVVALADDLYQRLDNAESGVYIFGGEPTVQLPENPGCGGRNQALALELAVRFSGRDNITVLVAGTDGSDGPTDAAGGLIDGSTVSDSQSKQAATEALLAANSGHYLREHESLFITGPTNTNVMDLVIAIIH